MKRTIILNRSAVTGRAVSKAYAKKHPRTTEREVYRVKK